LEMQTRVTTTHTAARDTHTHTHKAISM
jgi:hypothetical protein